jgi:hypothetical protein
MTMTAPAWLRLDAFDIPQTAVDELRRTITELRALVPQLDRLNARAKAAVDAIPEHQGLPDDVAAALRELTGEEELYDVLLVIGWCAAEITQSELTDDGREKIRERWGL